MVGISCSKRYFSVTFVNSMSTLLRVACYPSDHHQGTHLFDTLIVALGEKTPKNIKIENYKSHKKHIIEK